MSERVRLPVETHTPEEVIDLLILRNGQWALPLSGNLYTFDKDQTREQIEDIIRKAFSAYHSRYN